MAGANSADGPRAGIGLALACLLASVWPDPAGLSLIREAALAGQIWRLWTGHLVHFSLAHGLVDGAALLLCAVAAERLLGRRFVLYSVCLGLPLLSLGLLLGLPDLTEYRGASGWAVGLAAAAATALWRQNPARRPLVLALTALYLTKMVLDAWAEAASALPSGITVVWQAHLLGAILGALGAWLNRQGRRL